MTTTSHWHVPDEIDDALAADFDGSLSGLGMEIGTASFNMSEALMALPNLNSLKHENRINGLASQAVDAFRCLQEIASDITSDTSHSSDASHSKNQGDELQRPIAVVHGKKNRFPHNVEEDGLNNIKRFCVSKEMEDVVIFPSVRCRHSSSAPELRITANQSSPPNSLVHNSLLSQMMQMSATYPSTALRDCSPPAVSDCFQYVLGAATSISTKVHEETLTYLNQGQSYEIKLKKLGDLTEMKGKKLKSVIRVGFQERRLQYMEKELITQWQQQRPSERILEIDIPLSYGVCDVVNCPQNITLCEFLWDPTKETGVFIRVNCISTEFTPKKHGGEKGVPFRIQIETYTQDDSSSIRLHVASCQVKVFKPKGADRKHKTDREKMGKRPQAEQDKYQPSYDCTVFKECPVELLSIPSVTAESAPSPTTTTKSTSQYSPQSSLSDICPVSQQIENNPSTPASSTSELQEVPEASLQGPSGPLSVDATIGETVQWLQHNRFGNYVKVFSNFSGADVLRLSRDDLIQICGLADGIRLYNALHSRSIRPRLTIFVCLSSEPVFRAIYLENATVSDLIKKLSTVFNLSSHSIYDVFIYGPSGIHILVTDEVVQNIVEESMYTIEALKDQSRDSYRLLLKHFNQLA